MSKMCYYMNFCTRKLNLLIALSARHSERRKRVCRRGRPNNFLQINTNFLRNFILIEFLLYILAFLQKKFKTVPAVANAMVGRHFDRIISLIVRQIFKNLTEEIFVEDRLLFMKLRKGYSVA